MAEKQITATKLYMLKHAGIILINTTFKKMHGRCTFTNGAKQEKTIF